MKLREIPRSNDVTENSTGKAGKVARKGPKTWEIALYTYKEEPRDGHGPSHDDPRLESALQRLSLHQDDFIPSDDDLEYIHPAFGLGATASASFASDQGTLAGGQPLSLHSWNNDRPTPPARTKTQPRLRRASPMPSYAANGGRHSSAPQFGRSSLGWERERRSAPQ
jgi:hypothetical protein